MRDANVLGRLFASIAHFGDVAEEDRLIIRHARHYVAHVFGGSQELARLKQVFFVRGVELAGRQAPVGKP